MRVCIELDEKTSRILWEYAKTHGISVEAAAKKMIEKYSDEIDVLYQLVKEWLREYREGVN